MQWMNVDGSTAARASNDRDSTGAIGLGITAMTRRRCFNQVGFLLVAIAVGSNVDAAEAGACIARQVKFDGIEVLHYATVLTGQGQDPRPILYADYPSGCPSPADTKCTTTAEITPGDAVAVGKTCGTWAYVQHIGAASVVEGWLDSKRLEPIAARLPFDDGEPGGRERPDWWHAPYRIHMRLAQGSGVPVCEAYLQRLNQTVFREPPSCGRPENSQVPGFTRLNRVALRAAQVNRNYAQVFNLSHMTNDNGKLVIPPAERNDLAAIWSRNGRLDDGVDALVEPADVSAWRFEPPVDIDNDGVPDSVVIWRSFPPQWSLGMPVEACGVKTDSSHVSPEFTHVPLIFSPDYALVEPEKTLTIFGGSMPLSPQLEANRGRLGTAVPYQWLRPVGDSIEVFEYGGKYYFDTTASDGSNLLTDADRIDVYLRQQGTTQKVCAYRNLDSGWVPL